MVLYFIPKYVYFAKRIYHAYREFIPINWGPTTENQIVVLLKALLHHRDKSIINKLNRWYLRISFQTIVDKFDSKLGRGFSKYHI